MIDSHSHLYSEEFDTDRNAMIARAKEAGIKHVILPNVDSESLPLMLALESDYPNYCHAAMGLHPTSVAENYKDELAIVESELKRRKWIAIGEIGIDLYWDKTFEEQQVEAFRQQIEWALAYDLPIIIHTRASMYKTIEIVKEYRGKGLRGVFHCFSGSAEEAREIMKIEHFYFGIGGVVTFKNAGVAETLKEIPLDYLMLETDAPYLTPTPFRGKRNESAYIPYIATKLSEIYHCTTDEVAEITTRNAKELFRIAT